MRKWGNGSIEQLNTCTDDVQWLLTTVLEEVADVSAIEGHRNEERQNSLYPKYTKLKFPHGKHNEYPSKAVDVQPYPTPDTDVKLAAALGYIAGRAKAIGLERGLIVRWGGDWDQDGDLTDQTFDDLYHLEVHIDEENYIPLTDVDIAWLHAYGLGPRSAPDSI